MAMHMQPWTFDDEEIFDADGNLILECPNWRTNPGEVMSEQDRAHVRLAASAPELLRILERILYAHDTNNNGAAMGEAVLCRMFAEIARAALAKAKGE
jgi:hypothetical protein